MDVREQISRLLEDFTIEEILEADDLPVEEALEYLVEYGALTLRRPVD